MKLILQPFSCNAWNMWVVSKVTKAPNRRNTALFRSTTTMLRFESCLLWFPLLAGANFAFTFAFPLIFRAALERDLAVVAVSSEDRRSGCWRNKDAPRVARALEWVKKHKGWAHLPLFALGASSGGSFVGNLPKDVEIDGLTIQIMVTRLLAHKISFKYFSRARVVLECMRPRNITCFRRVHSLFRLLELYLLGLRKECVVADALFLGSESRYSFVLR